MKKDKAYLLQKIHGAQACQIVSVVARLNIVELLQNRPMSDKELSKHLDIDQALLNRLMSALVSLHILEETIDGKYCATKQGSYLSKDHPESLKDIAIYKGSNIYWKSLLCLLEGLKSNQSPFEMAFHQPLFEYLEDHKEDAEIFHNAMKSYETLSSKKIVDLYDFSQFATLADLGGSSGSFLQAILNKHPKIMGISFDLPYVIKQLTPSQSSNLTFMEGSFLKTLPQADGYILRNILHDWSDDKCIEILKNIQRHRLKSSKVLIFETLINKNKKSNMGKLSDLTMFTMTCGGKERSLEEYSYLFEQAGFHILQTLQTTSSKSLIELS